MTPYKLRHARPFSVIIDLVSLGKQPILPINVYEIM